MVDERALAVVESLVRACAKTWTDQAFLVSQKILSISAIRSRSS